MKENRAFLEELQHDVRDVLIHFPVLKGDRNKGHEKASHKDSQHNTLQCYDYGACGILQPKIIE
jgi:hypothetical protein